jgi:hypothetical protein
MLIPNRILTTDRKIVYVKSPKYVSLVTMLLFSVRYIILPFTFIARKYDIQYQVMLHM